MTNYRAYPEYSPDGFPNSWEQKRLRFALRMNPSKTEIDLDDSELVSFVPMDAVGEYGGIRLDEEKELSEIGSGYTYFCDDDVVVAKITPCFENGKGSVAKGLKNKTAFGTTELHVMRAGPEHLEPQFLFYLTISDLFRKIGESEMYGAGGQKRVPESFIKDFRAGIPPIREQQDIARFLDFKTAQIDALIAKKVALLDKLAEKRTALISHAVTKGLDPSVPMKDSGVAWLGEIPADWTTKRLRFLTSMAGGMTPATTNSYYWGGNTPWITPKDMKCEFLSGSIDTLTDEALLETGITLHEAGRVLIVVRGMILAHTFPVAINTVPTTVNQDMKALSTSLDCEYLALLLRGIQPLILSVVEESAHGTKVLRTDIFKNIRLPVPPVESQKIIVKRITSLIAKLDHQKKHIDSVIERLQEYRSALITNAVTGKIDVRGFSAPLTAVELAK
ncbi:restriction endonuclease subunit S [Pseudomonas sp. YY-1]|uniref:restriction endonuclease subunit S n=1 Tax=Pseudomonas sp. YY-1 TaxID=2058659 RepID=UPI000CAF4F49|nr:restriction endonuclease subunit S [Pseudomonas sp. YY-1]PKQ39013.1 restriction endonuclease subunit S [Pseudomonas sp. YY-1]